MVSNNIAAILKLEEEEERELSSLHRASHKVGWFVGTIYFVTMQVALVVVWVSWNIFYQPVFDPYPFPLLSTVLALEAVLLTSFVLIRQNTMDLRSERRNHLDLQINLLSEQENTRMIGMLQAIAVKVGAELSEDPELHALSEEIAPERLVQQIEARENSE